MSISNRGYFSFILQSAELIIIKTEAPNIIEPSIIIFSSKNIKIIVICSQCTSDPWTWHIYIIIALPFDSLVAWKSKLILFFEMLYS